MKPNNERIALKQGINELFEDQQLDDERLRLLRLAAGNAPARPARRRWLAAAALVVASVGVGVIGLRRGAGEDNVMTLADEIARNHITYGPGSGEALDAVGSSIAELRPAFVSLGFALLDAPNDPALDGATLLGGRFCTIASADAVQLRYRGPKGDVTVCQARYDARAHRDVPDMAVASAPAVRHVRGLQVNLCHMQGVLLAVTTA